METATPWTHLVQSVLNVYLLFSNVQAKNFSSVDNQRNHAAGDENGDEERSYRVESGPAIKLDKDGGYNDSDRSQGVLSKRKSKGMSY